MNRHFLEFWGKALLEAAKSQKQLEDLSKWFQQGFPGFQDFTGLFRTCYGLDKLPEDSPDYFSMWKKAEEDFRDSFKDYLNLLGMVPREEYADLARKYEELQEKIADRDETIRHLRMLADEKGMGLEAATLELQKLVKRQGDQFQQLLQGLGESVNAGVKD